MGQAAVLPSVYHLNHVQAISVQTRPPWYVLCLTRHNKSLICIQANRQLENPGEPIICCIGARQLTVLQVWFYVL